MKIVEEIIGMFGGVDGLYVSITNEPYMGLVIEHVGNGPHDLPAIRIASVRCHMESQFARAALSRSCTAAPLGRPDMNQTEERMIHLSELSPEELPVFKAVIVRDELECSQRHERGSAALIEDDMTPRMIFKRFRQREAPDSPRTYGEWL